MHYSNFACGNGYGIDYLNIAHYYTVILAHCYIVILAHYTKIILVQEWAKKFYKLKYFLLGCPEYFVKILKVDGFL